jgi:hypothetical protein
MGPNPELGSTITCDNGPARMSGGAMFNKLREREFQVQTLSHAEAILSQDFPQVAAELEEILLQSQMPIEEIIGSGGGEAKGTQRLRRALRKKEWRKHNFLVERIIDKKPLESRSHEIDHIKKFPKGTIALEIEWNNKDPFFDRDLENFKRLHADGAISVGVIVTRGEKLQDQMREFVMRFANEKKISNYDDVRAVGLSPTKRQIADVMKRVERTKNPIPFRDAWVDHFVGDKFGTATTHWRKLDDRVKRGVGNPCPLVLIGFPPSLVTFNEAPEVVAELIGEGFDAPDDMA